MRPARNHHFGIFGRKVPVAVVDDQGNLGDAHRGTFFRSRKDDALHLVHAKHRSALFPEHPANRIDDIRLARSVRPDDSRETAARKGDLGPLRKRLKSENL